MFSNSSRDERTENSFWIVAVASVCFWSYASPDCISSCAYASSISALHSQDGKTFDCSNMLPGPAQRLPFKYCEMIFVFVLSLSEPLGRPYHLRQVGIGNMERLRCYLQNRSPRVKVFLPLIMARNVSLLFVFEKSSQVSATFKCRGEKKDTSRKKKYFVSYQLQDTSPHL